MQLEFENAIHHSRGQGTGARSRLSALNALCRPRPAAQTTYTAGSLTCCSYHSVGGTAASQDEGEWAGAAVCGRVCSYEWCGLGWGWCEW